MKTRKIGDVTVSAIGLGAMPMSIEGRGDDAQGIATIHAALDAGVTLIDTADAYRLPAEPVSANELLIAKALKSYGGDTSNVLVATKGGHYRTSPTGEWGIDGRPERLKETAEASLKALDVDVIGLYQFHRPDPTVDYADSVGAIRDLLDEGKIRMAGISNASVEQVRLAQEILGGRLVSVQNQFSPEVRDSDDVLALSDELGLAFLPWSPLGGIVGAASLGERFGVFAEVGRDHGISPQLVALAWELAKSPVVIPIPGSSRPATIISSAQAPDIELTADEIARLDAA